MPKGIFKCKSSLRGFAKMSKTKRRKIATMGGEALYKKRGPEYMAKIGAIGGSVGNY